MSSPSEQRQEVPSDSGVWKRGMLLFGAIFLIAGIVLWTIFFRPEPPAREPERRIEEMLPALVVPGGGLPAAVQWRTLYDLGRELPSPKGWRVRYNATVALARRGSPKVPLGQLAEMLDEHRQLINFRKVRSDGKLVYDEAGARRTILTALRSLREWYDKRPDAPRYLEETLEGQAVLDSLRRLDKSPSQVLRTEALETLKHIENRAESG